MARDRADVPSRYIRVEGCFDLEQLAHARHQRHVPVRHLGSPRGSAVRAVTATRHAGGIDAEAVVHRGLQRSTVGKRAPGVDTECGIISGGSGPAAGAGRAQSVLDAFVLEARVEYPRTRWTVRRVQCVVSRGTREPGVGAREHPRRVGVVGEGPLVDVLQKARSAHEQIVRSRNLRHVPIRHVHASNGAAPPHRRVGMPAQPVRGAAPVPRRHSIQARVHGGLELGAVGKLPNAQSHLCQHTVGARCHAPQHVPGVALRDAGRAAHEGVGAVADGAVDGRKDASHALSLRVHPRSGRVLSTAAREPGIPCGCRIKYSIRIRDFGCVPAHRHGVECVGVVEHLPHVRDRADVPPR